MESRDVALAAVIARATHAPLAAIAGRQPFTGGCIHRVELVKLADGRQYCVKSNRDAGDMFAQEAYGLAAIRQVGSLTTPEVIAVEQVADDLQCLVLEAIRTTEPKAGFWQSFGAQLAEHHRRGTSSQFGWASDNYLGSTVQKNESRESWVAFFRECRLQYQLHLARQRGLGSRELYRLADRAIERLEKWLGSDDPQPSLLHGDLWSGNFLVGPSGEAVVIDPAVYYGDREAELAMPLLFGGFPPEFFDAYDEAWPLAEGWRDRVEIYQLYHLLNHLNLFGVGYLDSCLEILRRFAS
ncbi:MAG: fructosamine kinase family protein [Aureliella sp.]